MISKIIFAKYCLKFRMAVCVFSHVYMRVVFLTVHILLLPMKWCIFIILYSTFRELAIFPSLICCWPLYYWYFLILVTIIEIEHGTSWTVILFLYIKYFEHWARSNVITIQCVKICIKLYGIIGICSCKGSSKAFTFLILHFAVSYMFQSTLWSS